MRPLDFRERPFVVVWGLTGRISLERLNPSSEVGAAHQARELTPQEATRFIDQVADAGPAVLVLTGGDPLERADLHDIVRHATRRRLPVSLVARGTPRVTKDQLARLRDLGVQMMHVDLDGAAGATRDRLHGTSGLVQGSLDLLETLGDLGFPAQVVTTVSGDNTGELEWIARRVATYGVRLWTVVFPIAVPGGRASTGLTTKQAEAVWRWLAGIRVHAPFAIHTSGAPQFRRELLRCQRPPATPPKPIGAGYDVARPSDRAKIAGVNDGNGILFVDRGGDICPSAMLHLTAGNVRVDYVGQVYRAAPLFRELRDPAMLEGKCGRCRFSHVCGGSRARAFAATRSHLGDDPLCGDHATPDSGESNREPSLLTGRDS